MDTNFSYGRIGPIAIKSAKDNKFKPRLYPKDLLIKFINVNPKDKNAIFVFCSRYHFFPRNLTKGWRAGFEKEWRLLNAVFDKVVTNNLSTDDINQINKQIERISVSTKQVNEKTIVEINKLRDKRVEDKNIDDDDIKGLYDHLNIKNKDTYLIPTKKYQFSAICLWEDLLKLAQSKQSIKNCSECGLFFVPDKYIPRQRFCNENCKDRYHKRQKKMTSKTS